MSGNSVLKDGRLVNKVDREDLRGGGMGYSSLMIGYLSMLVKKDSRYVKGNLSSKMVE